MDAFYAAVEMRDKPELKDKPMAVGGSSMLVSVYRDVLKDTAIQNYFFMAESELIYCLGSAVAIKNDQTTIFVS